MRVLRHVPLAKRAHAVVKQGALGAVLVEHVRTREGVNHHTIFKRVLAYGACLLHVIAHIQ